MTQGGAAVGSLAAMVSSAEVGKRIWPEEVVFVATMDSVAMGGKFVAAVSGEVTERFISQACQVTSHFKDGRSVIA